MIDSFDWVLVNRNKEFWTGWGWSKDEALLVGSVRGLWASSTPWAKMFVKD